LEGGALEFDTLIVGGGSAGCVLAARLSEDPNRRVALLEAGGRDRSPWLHVPAGTLRLRGAHWNYAAEPDASRNGSVDPWRTGRVIGGGSAVNAMVWVRGHPADFDDWAEAGATGWDYASLLPYFQRAETWEEGADDFRGGSGPQRVSWGRCQHPVTDAFIEAAQQAGHPFNPDYNAERQEGAAFSQVSQRRGWRHSTARAYLSRARRRANLKVLQEAFVTRVLFEHQRAVGVEYRQGAELKRLHCTREVIVSAGTIASPKILLASGVGPAAHLQDHGVPVVADNPAVGRNLQEHATTMMLWHVNVRTLNTELTPWGFVRHGLNYALRGRGPASASMGHALVFFRLDPESPSTQVEAQFCPMGMLGSQGSEDGDQLMPGTHDVTQMQTSCSAVRQMSDGSPRPVAAYARSSSRPRWPPMSSGKRCPARAFRAMKSGTTTCGTPAGPAPTRWEAAPWGATPTAQCRHSTLNCVCAALRDYASQMHR
jgi:choline dehydrogenase